MVQVDSNVMADMDMFKPKEETVIQVDTDADKFKLKSRKGHGSGDPVTACASTVMAMDISNCQTSEPLRPLCEHLCSLPGASN